MLRHRSALKIEIEKSGAVATGAAVEKNDLSTRYALDVQFSCTLNEWITFLYRIEASPSLFEVGRAGITRGEGEGSNISGTLKLVSATPSFPESALPLALPTDGDTDATPVANP